MVDGKIVLIGALLLCAVLLFGCTGGGNGSGAGGGTQAQAQGGAQSGAGAQGGAGAGAQATAAPTTAAQGGGAAGGGGNDFTGKGYAELVAMGVPVQCDVQMSVQGGSSSSKMYLSSGRASVESQTTVEGTTIEMKVVSKDKKVYSSVPAAMKIAGTPYANCDWIVMDEIEAKQPENKQVDYAEIPATRFSCLPWVPDESKFATPGATCGSQQLMPSTPATPSMPSGFSECNGLTGQELVDCIQKTQG